MANQEKPRDVSGVELLMNNHQGLKAEIDAREENFVICVNLGKDLLARKHSRSPEVRERLTLLAMQRGGLMAQWEEGWEYLQLILEVYQFARDASVAETWLITHEPYLSSEDFGETLDAVEILLKKHEAFERAAATQEERFIALERITTMELRHRQKLQQEEYERQHPGSKMPVKRTYADRYLEEFLPPPEPEPEPEPIAVPVKEIKTESRPPISEDVTDTTPAGPAQKPHDKSPDEAGSSHEAASAGEPSETFEGTLVRKHEWESTTKKASNRTWEKVYVVLSSNVLQFYKDQKHARADPKGHYRSQIDLEGTTAVAATDYNKRPNVFRLKLANGGDYLFQSKDEDEMNNWISRINAASGADAASSPSRAQTMPATVEGGHRDEPKKRSFFTLGKKK
jgi:spectrin beta